MLKKSFFVSIFLFFVLTSCNHKNKSENLGDPTIDFEHLDFDFGTIQIGEKVAHRFIFKNNGKGDLLIKDVSADCGCTIADYKKEPIAPGQESFIEAVFDSEGFPGMRIKMLTVLSNANDSAIVLSISAAVDYSLEKGF